jgi:plastocyanin
MKKLTPTLAICCAAFGVAVVSAAAGWGADAKAPPTVVADTIAISGFVYSPDPFTAAAGATVTVQNADGVPHTVTADDGVSFNSGFVQGGESGTLTAPAAPGSYTYFCEAHPNDSRMHGTLVVNGS